jgi:hypothetical protein
MPRIMQGTSETFQIDSANAPSEDRLRAPAAIATRHPRVTWPHAEKIPMVATSTDVVDSMHHCMPSGA